MSGKKDPGEGFGSSRDVGGSFAPVRGRPRAANNKPEGIASLDVALNILRAISDSDRPISLSDISRITGEKPNKLHRYLVSFRERGFLLQNEESGHYDLGPAAYRLGMAALRRYDPMADVTEAITRIRNVTGNQTNLYVWTPMGPTLIASEQGVHSFPLTIRLGSALSLLTSATGRVFLAWMPREKVQERLDEEEDMIVGEGGALDMAEVERELVEIRRCEIYWSNRAIVSSSAALMPLFDEKNELVCCITSIMPRGVKREEIRSSVEAALLSARDRLAFNGPPK